MVESTVVWVIGGYCRRDMDGYHPEHYGENCHGALSDYPHINGEGRNSEESRPSLGGCGW